MVQYLVCFVLFKWMSDFYKENGGKWVNFDCVCVFRVLVKVVRVLSKCCMHVNIKTRNESVLHDTWKIKSVNI